MKALNPNGKLVFLYLITNPYTHASGIYVLNLKHAATDIGLTANTLSAALDTLSKLGICMVDPLTEVVWVRKMMSYQGRGDKNLRSAAYHVAEDLHGSYLVDEFLLEYPAVAKFIGERRKSTRQSIPTALRFKVLERDGNRCKACGATPEIASLEVDHVKPESLGGETILENLQTLCQPCNLGKSNRVSGKTDRVSEFGTPNSPFLVPDPDPDSRNLNTDTREPHGQFANVLLKPQELQKLHERFGQDGTEERIEVLSEAMSSKGLKYSNHYATILSWERRNGRNQNGTHRQNQATGTTGKPKPPSYTPRQ